MLADFHPAQSPTLVIRLSTPEENEWANCLPRCKHLVLIVAPIDWFDHDLLGGDLLSGQFAGLEHLEFRNSRRNGPGEIPSALLVASSNIDDERFASVSFSSVLIPLPTITSFLEKTMAGSLVFFHSNIVVQDVMSIPKAFTMSTTINHIDLCGLDERLSIALINGCLKNNNDIRITLNPDMLTQTLWESIRNNFGACRILELEKGMPCFGSQRKCNILGQLQNSADWNRLLELRFTDVKFAANTYLELITVIEKSVHLKSIKIDGWSPVYDLPSQEEHPDMQILFQTLSKLTRPIWFTFEDAPFYALPIMIQHSSHLQTSLFHMECSQPPDDWYHYEKEGRLQALAKELTQNVIKNKIIGCIDNPKKIENACNFGFYVTIDETQFLSEQQVEQLGHICKNNHEIYSHDTELNLNRIIDGGQLRRNKKKHRV